MEPPRPRLRSVDSFVTEVGGEPTLVLRDPTGVAKTPALVPLALAPVVGRFTGKSTLLEIRAALARDEGLDVPLEAIAEAARTLAEALFLEGPRADAATELAHRTFVEAAIRPAAFAGSAYPGPPSELASYIVHECVRPGFAPEEPLPEGRPLRALVLPHIDPWRGARGYGACVRALAHVPEAARTFVLLGTSHAPMRAPFALCAKAFDTPLGPLAPHENGLARLAAAARFDPHEDLLNHRNEHSIEFSAVFLRHALGAEGARDARIVPILCGLGRAQLGRTDPRADDEVRAFLDELAAFVDEEDAIVLAGADLAHVGPRFGDAAYRPDERRALEARDRGSLGLARAGDAAGFFRHATEDRTTRRVCGTGPVYTLLATLSGSEAGHVLYYEQTRDAEEGSIVSHAGLAFVAPE